MDHNFRLKGTSPPIVVGVRKVAALIYYTSAEVSFVLSPSTRLTDRQTDIQNFDRQDRSRIAGHSNEVTGLGNDDTKVKECTPLKKVMATGPLQVKLRLCSCMQQGIGGGGETRRLGGMR